MKHAILAALLVLTFSCAKKMTVKPSEDTIAFHSFIFFHSKKENFNASADTVIVRSSRFKMRVFDNFLNRHLFDFVSAADGMNRVIVPDRKAVYQSSDEVFSRILTEFVFILFDSNRTALPEYDKINGFILEKNRIKTIMFDYGGQAVSIDVLKRFEDELPRRIRIKKLDEDILFDIVSFTAEDFTADENGFIVVDRQGGTLFDWLGLLKN